MALCKEPVYFWSKPGAKVYRIYSLNKYQKLIYFLMWISSPYSGFTRF